MASKGQYSQYPEDLWSKITQDIENKMSQTSRPLAAFDADGTLWDIDMGESFFQFQQDQKLVELPEDPWGHYKLLKTTVHPTCGYLWLAQICSGLNEETVKLHCEQHLDSLSKISVFESQKKLIDWMTEKGIEVYVVTASIKWPVAAAAQRYLGIPNSHVIGVEVEIDNGKLTETQKGDITYLEGKPKRLLEETQGVNPIFCSGNTLGDQHLLESSIGLQLAVTSAETESRMFHSELKLQNLAQEKGWLRHQF